MNKLCFLAMVILSCCTISHNGNSEPVRVNKHTIYYGILPCADCTGIETTLDLNSGDTTEMSYTLTRTYLGKNSDSIFIIKGTYHVERGLGNDMDATVFILNSDKKKEDQKFFVQYSSDTTRIYLLDQDTLPIISNLDYSMQKK